MSAENKKTKIGKVIKISGNKTISVLTEGRTMHPHYKKTIRTRRKFLAHDSNSIAKVGDKVKIIEGRPVSKLKSWELKEIEEKVDQ